MNALGLVSALLSLQASGEDIKQRTCECIYHESYKCCEEQGYDAMKSPAETSELSWGTRKAFLEEMVLQLRSEVRLGVNCTKGKLRVPSGENSMCKDPVAEGAE